MRKLKKNRLLLIAIISLTLLIVFKVYASSEFVDVSMNNECTLDIVDNGARNSIRDIMINVNDILPGKRITGFKYCLADNNCNDDNNWVIVSKDDENKDINAFANSVGNNTFTFWINVPEDHIKLVATFEDFEPMNISYAKFLKSTNNENEYQDIYVDAANDINNPENYETSFTDIVTGYMGGDIVLPEDCTSNGCLLKVSMSKIDYLAMKGRLDADNGNQQNQNELKEFVDLSSMFNHLENHHIPTDTLSVVRDNEQNIVIDVDDSTATFYLIVNKFFSEKNRSNIVVGDNQNRIISVDYIGLNYKVDRKYFDEGNMYGFLTFNEENEYKQTATIFYGTPVIQFSVDSVIAPALATGGDASGMGTIKNPYTKIVSNNQSEYPIDSNFELTINSFYNPDYVIPISLKDDENKTVKDVTLTLSRFAFGEAIPVNEDGVNCRRLDLNPNCTDDNAYLSAEYRGLYDTFYSDGSTVRINEEQPLYKKAFEISHQQEGIMGRILNNETVYARNMDFNPWAVAIFYHDEDVIATRSFNLGELMKIEGYSEEPIPADLVNGIAKDNNEIINDYNPNDYSIYAYGLGYEIPINKVKYFYERNYFDGNLNHTLIIASKKELEDNNINRVALFLTNGELTSEEENFPELTYGVGEGKIFEIDHRTFDRMGSGE